MYFLEAFLFLFATNQVIKIGPVKRHDNEILITMYGTHKCSILAAVIAT